jgi:transcriptional regulator with XRE-family HTH domain
MRSTRIGLAIRELRLRRGWRQSDLARASGVSRWRIGRIEGDRLKSVAVGALEAVASALGASLTMAVDWHGAELDRLLNRRHAVLHDVCARLFERLPDWEIAAEVSFSVYGEHGIIDVLAYHRASGALLVIELKTELVDPQALVGTMDRRLRLADRIARDRGWTPRSVSGWVIFTEGRTNRRRVGAHARLLRGAFPADGRAIRSWLAKPAGAIRALSFLSVEHSALADRLPAARRRAPRVRPSVSSSQRTVE